jgi:hypothetical protein
MSSLASTPGLKVGSGRGPALPKLRLLAPPLRPRWRPPFVAVCVAVMLGCLIGLLMINIALTRGAYREHQLELKQTELMETQQALAEKVAAESSPAVLSQRARDLGMIPNSTPAFIRLSDGTVLGQPTPAQPQAPAEAAPLAPGSTLTAEQQQQAAELAAAQAEAKARADAAAIAAGLDPATLGDAAVPITPTTQTASGAAQNSSAQAGSGQAPTLPSATPVDASANPGAGAATTADGATGGVATAGGAASTDGAAAGAAPAAGSGAGAGIGDGAVTVQGGAPR